MSANFNFPKNINFSSIQNHWQKMWKQHKAFRINPDKPAKSMVLPPPNVTGKLHLGHALNGTLQDIIARFWRMNGIDVLWQGGTDHAGIATQIMVERALAQEGLDRKSLGRDTFIKKVWQWKDTYSNHIEQQLSSLGLSLSHTNFRFTMDEEFSRAVGQTFISFYEKGWIYQDSRLVNWDCQLETAVSDLEVHHKTESSTMFTIRYKLDSGEFLDVATTRPETLFGDQALAVHPDNPRFQAYIGKKACIPLENRWIPIIADQHANPEKGTGVVKITPAHDFDDAEVGKRHHLTPKIILDTTGKMNHHVPADYQGLTVSQARNKIVNDLQSIDRLIQQTPHEHAVPYSQRSDTVIEPRLTMQWYLDVKTLAQQALNHDSVRWIPLSSKNTYQTWMHNIQPWCISRQLWWGHTIPAWYGPDKKIFVAMTESEAAEKAKKYYQKNVVLTRETDVLDTWFSSAFWPMVTMGWPHQTEKFARYYPTSLLVTGPDIIFFWVARMMMMGQHYTGTMPFDTVMIHPLIQDEKGKKMSKTRGNVVDPLHVIHDTGADALRFALSSLASPAPAVRFTEGHLNRGRHFVTKLWNVVRFCYAHDIKGVCHRMPTTNIPLNLWMLDQWNQFLSTVNTLYQAYNFHELTLYTAQFVWDVFCDRYIEGVKAHLNDDTTRSCILFFVVNILKILHPIIPFVTEELWHLLTGEFTESFLMHQSWPETLPALTQSQKNLSKSMTNIWLLIDEIRSAQGALETYGAFTITATNDMSHKINLKAYLPFLQKQIPQLNSSHHITDVQFYVKILVNTEAFTLQFQEGCAEKAYKNLHQKYIREEKLLQTAQQRMHNKTFCEKANQDVIEDMKNRIHNSKQRIQQMQSWLQQFNRMPSQAQ